MPFPRNNIAFRRSFGTCQIPKTIEDESTGTLKEIMEDCNKKLPDAEKFEIANQIKAGMQLQEVNTKVLSNANTVNEKKLEEAIQNIEKAAKKTEPTNQTNNQN